MSTLLLLLAACGTSTGVHPLGPDGVGPSASADRLLNITTGTLVGPTDTGTAYGHVVDVVGDVNADGYDDVMVGALNDASGNGRAYLYLGGGRGVVTTAAMTFDGDTAGALFAATLAGVGDLNGDGYADVAIGAYAYNSNTGRVYVHYGSSRGVSGTADLVLDGPTEGGFFGFSMAGLGDTNGDGYDDLAVGAYGIGTGTGAVFVYQGGASGPTGTPEVTLTGVEGSGFGTSILGADVQGDGYADLIAGGPGLNTDTGAVWVYPGGSTGLRTTPTTTLNGENAGDLFGAVVRRAGDENGDGFDEILVGAHGYNGGDGRAYQFPGSSLGLGTTIGWTLDGDAGDLGRAMATGDFDGNGRLDAVFGEAQYSSTLGRVRTYSGDGIAYGTTAADEVPGVAEGDLLGISLGVGDLDGDGAADLVVAAQGADSGLGAVYVYPGLHATIPDNDHDGHTGANDCDEEDDQTYVGATEVVGDGKDQDCDGGEICFVDGDDDGYLDGDGSGTVTSTNGDCADPGEGSTSDAPGDCDDGAVGVNPGATEIPGDGIDQNCDGVDGAADDTGGGDTDTDTDADTDADTALDTNTDTAGGDDTATDEADKGGCGCASGGEPGGASGAVGALLLGVALVRRRHRA